MGYNWKVLSIHRFFGLELKVNQIDVKDGFSSECLNVIQAYDGVVSKRRGYEQMFSYDEASTVPIDECGSCKLNGTKYYFIFADGKFKYSNSLTGTKTVISPTPAISTTTPIYWAVLDDKLFFVDGVNALRYFDGSDIKTSSIYARPTVAPIIGVPGGFDYAYTVDNGLGESPITSNVLLAQGSALLTRIEGNTGPQTLVAGDIVRIYSKATTVAAAYKLVATHTWTAANVTATFANIATVAINDSQAPLYTDAGIVVNKSAVTAMEGITEHYGRLVGWAGGKVYNSKVTNPHSWPDDSARKEAFVYGFFEGDGENIVRCISFRESLYVMKPTKIAIFGGVGPDDTGGNAYSFRRMETNGNGCVAGKSVAVVGENESSVLVYLSRTGFMSTSGADANNVGESIEPIVQADSQAVMSGSVAYHHKIDGLYICFFGPTDARIAWVLDVRKDSGVMVGWFKWGDLPVKCAYFDEDRTLIGTYTGYCASERVDGVDTDFADILVEHVIPTNVNTGTDAITVTTDYPTGTEIKVRSNGTIPAGITANATYYVIRVSASSVKLATSLALAQAGTNIDITSQGAGVHSLITKKAISSRYVTNWLKFKDAAIVKKLGKTAVIVNSGSSSVAIQMQTAYDWNPAFGDSNSIVTAPTHPWGSGVWGAFVWGGGTSGSPKNVAIARRKCRSIQYRFENNTINQDFNLQGIQQPFDYIRNRGNFA